jgi:hypothetical protein
MGNAAKVQNKQANGEMTWCLFKDFMTEVDSYCFGSDLAFFRLALLSFKLFVCDLAVKYLPPTSQALVSKPHSPKRVALACVESARGPVTTKEAGNAIYT